MSAPGTAPMPIATIKDIADAVSDIGWAVLALTEHPEVRKASSLAPAMRVIGSAAEALAARLDTIVDKLDRDVLQMEQSGK